MTDISELIVLVDGYDRRKYPRLLGFRKATIADIKGWIAGKDEPCTFCNLGQVVVTIQDQAHADRYNAIHGTAYTVGCEFTIACGACKGTMIRHINTEPTHIWFLSNNGKARQAKVNGKIRTWKRDQNRIEIPVKYGLYEYATFTTADIESGKVLIPVNMEDSNADKR